MGHGQPATLLKEGIKMSENQIALSKQNGKFNRIVATALANGFAVEVKIEEDQYGEFAFAVIKRFDGECKNYLDILNSADRIYLSSSYSVDTKRSSMNVRRSSYTDKPNKISMNRMFATFSVWADDRKSVAEVAA